MTAVLQDIGLHIINALDQLRCHNAAVTAGMDGVSMEKEKLLAMAAGQIQIMEDHNDSDLIFPGNGANQLQNFLLVVGIQIAGGLIQQQQTGLLG